mmetsp:Transcript_28556/g.44980  ORF Transcript_28556/g.44980 Transcript_28556/m.44980 type:complete len:143 (-) Transcript_28556:1007-1435(-)
MTGPLASVVDAIAIMPPTDEAVGAACGSSNQGGKIVDMNKDQTNTEASTGGNKRKGDPEQKDTSDTKTSSATSSARYYTDIYGRVPGKEPKYPIPCPNCKRELAVSRFCQHLEKCMGLGGRGVSSSHSSSSGSQAKRRKSSI